MSPALIDALLDVQRRAHAAGHGGKQAVYAAACQHLNMSRATLMRRLKEVAVQPQRKRRSDAGTTSLSLADAQELSSKLMEGFRANDKSIQQAYNCASIVKNLDGITQEDYDFFSTLPCGSAKLSTFILDKLKAKIR